MVINTMMSTKMSKKRLAGDERGIITIELLLALGFTVVILAGASFVVFGGQTAGLDVNLTNHAVYRATNELSDELVSQRTNWNPGAGSAKDDDIYKKVSASVPISPCLMAVETDVTWSSEHARAQWITLETLLANVEEARAQGGGCNPFPPSGGGGNPPGGGTPPGPGTPGPGAPGAPGGPEGGPGGSPGGGGGLPGGSPLGGGWDNPDTLSFGHLDVSSEDLSSLDLFTLGGVRYLIVGFASSGLGGTDLVTLDVSDPVSPKHLSYDVFSSNGLNDIDAAFSYVYAVRNDREKQLIVIDMSDPSGPRLQKEVTLPGVNKLGAHPEGKVVRYYDEAVYVGTGQTAGPEFHVFDVLDPSSPVSRGSLEIGFDINAIAVSGPFAFVASSGDANEIMTIDISGSNPSFVSGGTIDLPGNEDATSIFVVGNRLYVGRNHAPDPLIRNFFVFSIDSAGALQRLGSTRLPLSPGTGIRALSVQGSNAFVATSDPNAGFMLLDISDPLNMVLPNGCSSYGYGAEAVDLVYGDNLVFIAGKGNPAFRILYDKPGQCTN